jgi:hypothetical protein
MSQHLDLTSGKKECKLIPRRSNFKSGILPGKSVSDQLPTIFTEKLRALYWSTTSLMHAVLKTFIIGCSKFEKALTNPLPCFLLETRLI